MPAASKQLHNSEKEAPCNEHVKLMNSQITFELMFVYETRVAGIFIINISRERPKSAPYLRLKKTKTTFSTTGDNQSSQKN